MSDNNMEHIQELELFSDEELEQELQRRMDLALKLSMPKQLGDDEIDLTSLRKICDRYMHEVVDGWVDSDTDHYIVEEALKTIYGPEVFDWINENLR